MKIYIGSEYGSGNSYVMLMDRKLSIRFQMKSAKIF